MAIVDNTKRIRAVQRGVRMALGLLIAIPAIWLPIAYFMGLAGEQIRWQDYLALVIPALLLPVAFLLFNYRPTQAAGKISLAEAAQAEHRAQPVRGLGQMLLYSGLGTILLQTTPLPFFPKAAAGFVLIVIALALFFRSRRL